MLVLLYFLRSLYAGKYSKENKNSHCSRRYALLKQADGQAAVTYNFIRKLCDNGTITSIRAGKKILINYDELLSYLNIDETC